jgi:hypothetical protein
MKMGKAFLTIETVHKLERKNCIRCPSHVGVRAKILSSTYGVLARVIGLVQ